MTIDATGAEVVGAGQPSVNLMDVGFELVDAARHDAGVDEDHLGRERLLEMRALRRFIDSLIEDYGDEWLSKCMFHYRWAYAPDTKKASAYMPYGQMMQMTREQGDQFEKMIAQRQISRIGVVGSNEVTAPIIEASWRRYLEIFDAEHSEAEDRFIAIGAIDRGIVVVVYTEREENLIRIIGARLPTNVSRSCSVHTWICTDERYSRTDRRPIKESDSGSTTKEADAGSIRVR